MLLHPLALCESDDVGARTRIWAFAHVLHGAVIGTDCNICDHVFVEGGASIGSHVTVKNGVVVWHGVTLEDGVFVGPGAVFTNDLTPRAMHKKNSADLLSTLVQKGATIGANATIVCGTTIGQHAFIAAGAVVTTDVASHALVTGNPARPKGWVCECGARLATNLTCPCGRSYSLVNDAVGLTKVFQTP